MAAALQRYTCTAHMKRRRSADMSKQRPRRRSCANAPSGFRSVKELWDAVPDHEKKCGLAPTAAEMDVVDGAMTERVQGYSRAVVSCGPDQITLLQGGRDRLTDVLSWTISRGWITFPWKRLYLGSRAPNMMSELRALQPSSRVDRGPGTTAMRPHNVRFHSRLLQPLVYFGGGCRPLVWRSRADDYAQMDVLVDLYQEGERLEACRKDQSKSPMELWRTDPRFVKSVLHSALHRTGGLSSEGIRESVYRLCRECTQFKPSLAVCVIRHLGARRVLDISAGWGDRMAGAIAAGVDRYLGFDPNLNLRAGHEMLLDAHTDKREERDRFRVVYESFEDNEGVLPAEECDPDFDLVLSSPPFFDFERYTTLPGQSADKYPHLVEWQVRFLARAMSRAWRCLRTGGHMVLHLTDVYRDQVCEPTGLLAVWLLPGCQYRGVMLSVGAAGKPRPLWVFRKGTASGVAGEAALELRVHFGPVWSEALRCQRGGMFAPGAHEVPPAPSPCAR